jgi:basic membrane protein A
MALPGPKNDKGFNQSHYEGLLLAQQQLGIKPNVVENVVDPDKRIDALKNLAADNQVVIGVGGEFAEAGVTVAPQFPNVQFMIINGQASDAKNLHIYGVRQGVPAYVAGVLTPKLGTIKKAGFVGGEEIPPTTQSNDGYKAGLAASSQDLASNYASTIVGNFNDSAKAKEAAAAQIADGADVIFGMVDAGLDGLMQAVSDSGKDVKVFSVIVPRCDEFPQIAGTAVLNSQELVKSIVQDYQQNTMPAQPKFYGVENPSIQRFQLCPKYDTPELRQIVDETQQGINNHSIQLPDGV